MRISSNKPGCVSWFYSVLVLLVLPTGLHAQQPLLPQQQGDSGKAQLARARAFGGKTFPLSTANADRSSNKITITADLNSLSGSQSFSLRLPVDADARSLKVTLNGHDVSSRFSGSTGFVTFQDGLATTKNVLSATVTTTTGTIASGRWRSMNVAKKTATAAVTTRGAIAARAVGLVVPRATPSIAATPVCDPVAMCPAWLPPSVRFDTLTPGGWTLGSSPWIAVNGVDYGSSAGTVGSPHYALIAFDRQTLELTDFQWFDTGPGLTNQLTKYPPSTIVVAGTTALPGNTLAGDVDTSLIGGTNFANWKGAFPQSYMIIGSVGQQPGTAYENMQSSGSFSTGSFQEDSNGNYGFQSTDVVEYAIQPQDADWNNIPTLEMNVPVNLRRYNETRVIIQANAPINANGLWMLVLDRTNPMPPLSNDVSGCYDYPALTGIRTLQNCGIFYPVGDLTNPNGIDPSWHALAAALRGVSSNQLVILQSVGSVGSGDLFTTVQSGNVNNLTGFQDFAEAFQSVGGTPMTVAGPNFNSTDTYAFVGYLGASNALAGNVAEVSTALPGQSGVLHGTLQRDGNGLYRPAQTSAEPQGMFLDKGALNASDFTMSVASYQQPGVWPSNNPTVLLPNAGSLDGQQAAYRFVSHWLLANYYMKGLQGPHQDDIHYFFSGSTNTSLDYHTMDPGALQFPGIGTWDTFGCTTNDGTTCTFQATGDSGPSSFTKADFNAVTAQLSLEVTYLTNTLQFLVNGSTNLKDVVANGNANVGLALNAAASTVLGSGMAGLDQASIESKQVSFSWQTLLSTLGGIAATAANLESFGETTVAWDELSPVVKGRLKQAASIANTVGSVIGTVGSGSSILSTTSARTQSPQPFAQLTATVGNLATANLSSPLLVGFDTMADNITSDWGRLSTIGPRVTNTSDSTFFAPNQVAQIGAINALTTSSLRTFYFSLLPQVFNLHYWSGVQTHATSLAIFQPTMGSYQSHTEGPTCNAFYLTPNSNYDQTLGTLPNAGVVLPSVGGTLPRFAEDEGNLDVWVIDGPVAKAGSQSTHITSIDSDLGGNLFSVNQLNIPTFQFFALNGPMASVVKIASVDKISGWDNADICDASDPIYSAPSGAVGGSPGGKSPTTTTLTSPMSGVLGRDATFTAQVMAGNQPVTSGTVYLSVDGKVVGSPSLTADGTASITIAGGLTLGNHQIQADYAAASGYAVSSTTPSTFVVYSESPDIAISMTNATLNVSFTTASTPVALQIGSIAGLSGDVVLSCTGLPAGLACNFSSQSLKLTANGAVTASMQVVPSPTPQASFAVLLLPLLGLVGLRRSRFVLSRVVMLVIAVSVAAVALTGCSGGSPTTGTPIRETGSRTITINARVGSVSRSIGVDINVQ